LKDELLVPVVGAVSVALIGGGISLVLAILAKDQKTSEFRQAWIEGVREDVSKLVAHFMVVATFSKMLRGKTQADIHQYIMSKEEHFLEISLLVIRIRLRMNKREHASFLKLLLETEGVGADNERYEKMVDAIVTQSQDILKAEWVRVKGGERSFRLLKSTSKVLLLAGLLSGGWLAYTYFIRP